MKRGDYMAAVTEAMSAAQIDPELGLVVEGDTIRAIATYLPTVVLKAVVANQIIADGRDITGNIRFIPMHPGWVAACDDELIDRMLTESLSDERKEPQAEADPEEGKRKETPKKGTPQVYR